MEKYELVKDFGDGSFGQARLLRNKETKETFAVKYIKRSHEVDDHVAREIINHRSLKHPNIIRFKEVFWTPTHLAIVMEHATGGTLLNKIRAAGRFNEYVARYYFQQLISGVHYCHNVPIRRRDLKLENVLLDGSPAPCLKICDLGCYKSSLLLPRPKSNEYAQAYVAPEAISDQEYDGMLADVWSCGVTLYAMLTGAYPFEDQDKPGNIQKTIQRIVAVQFKIPDYVHVSQDCKDLLSRIFVASPSRRISVMEIKSHPWFLKNLPKELTESVQAVYYRSDNPGFSFQSVEEIMKIVGEARWPSLSSKAVKGFGWGVEDEEEDEEEEEEDVDAEVEEKDRGVEHNNMVWKVDASEGFMNEMDKYDFVNDLGAGSFGTTRLMKDKLTRQLVAIKYILRGHTIDENVQREIINHRSLNHPNVIRFKEVFLTPTHLAIVMEHAAGGELLERIRQIDRFSEDEARYFFQQLICGVSYCHSMQVSHRDLKLSNILLDGNPAPCLKICDFGYSVSSVLHATPKETVGTPSYMAPEVLIRREYDGKLADVWSCGVALYVMLMGAYPFKDEDEPRNFRRTVQRILEVQYEIPDDVNLSQDCRHLLSHIFVTDPNKRISIVEIRNHPWFLKNLPEELPESSREIYFQMDDLSLPRQSLDEIMQIVAEATLPSPGSCSLNEYLLWDLDEDEEDEDVSLDVDSDGEIIYAL